MHLHLDAPPRCCTSSCNCQCRSLGARALAQVCAPVICPCNDLKASAKKPCLHLLCSAGNLGMHACVPAQETPPLLSQKMISPALQPLEWLPQRAQANSAAPATAIFWSRRLTGVPPQVRAPFLWQGKRGPAHAALATAPEQAQEGSATTPAAAGGGCSHTQQGIGGGTLLLRRPAAQGLPQQRDWGARAAWAGVSEDLCQDHLQRRHLGRCRRPCFLAARCVEILCQALSCMPRCKQSLL